MPGSFAPYLREIKELIEMVVSPIVIILLPAIVTSYYKIMKSLKRMNFAFGKGIDARTRDWEANASRNILQSLGFFLDGVDSNPYCRADQILYLGVENGVVGPSRIHSMYLSVHAENSGISRCSKKASELQRIPYTSLSAWCASLEEQIVMRLSKITDSVFSELRVHETAKSAIIVPVYTKEHWLAGIVVFNYFDEDFNFQEDTSKDEELLESIRVFVEGQILQMDLARLAWLRDQ